MSDETRVTIGERIRQPSIGALIALGAILFGVLAGLLRLDDNSLFTHLATGRLIFDNGGIPHHDPYSWSAHGAPWVVQSWLPSILYAGVEKAGGALALRAFFGLQVIALSLIACRLARRAPGVLPRVAIVGLVLLVGKAGWSERPLLIGLLCLGAALLAVDGQLRPAWLVPIGWVWTNSHGSFPLGVGMLLVMAIGSRLDGERRPAELTPLAYLTAGVLLGAVSPLGPKLLLFPVELLGNMSVLRHVIEWHAPGFEDLWQRVFLVQLVLAWLGLVRRPSWRAGLVTVVASALALTALRNVVVASLVLTPLLAAAWGELGELRVAARSRLNLIAAALLVAVIVLVTSARLSGADYEVARYPFQAVSWLRAQGIDSSDARMVHEDFTGNFLELIEGERASVFYDDRYDMYPKTVSDDYYSMVSSTPGSLELLDHYKADVVLWRRTETFTRQLEHGPLWRVVYVDDSYVIACRRSAPGEACRAGL
jgi:hypothetical protein